MEDKEKNALVYAFNTLNNVSVTGYENVCHMAGGLQIIKGLIDGVQIDFEGSRDGANE